MSTSAATVTAWNNKLTSGTKIAYRIASNCQYTTSIPNAVQRLMYPPGMSNPIVLWKTDVYMDSKMDFYQYYNNWTDANINAYAETYRKIAGQYYRMYTYEKDLYDWIYGDISINDYNMDPYSNNTRELVIMHEMMHVYGSIDIDNQFSILYRYTPTCNGLTSDANSILNDKY